MSLKIFREGETGTAKRGLCRKLKSVCCREGQSFGNRKLPGPRFKAPVIGLGTMADIWRAQRSKVYQKKKSLL